MKISINRLIVLHAAVADLACEDPIYLPIFARLDAELDMALLNADPIMKARALAKQIAA